MKELSPVWEIKLRFYQGFQRFGVEVIGKIWRSNASRKSPKKKLLRLKMQSLDFADSFTYLHHAEWANIHVWTLKLLIYSSAASLSKSLTPKKCKREKTHYLYWEYENVNFSRLCDEFIFIGVFGCKTYFARNCKFPDPCSESFQTVLNWKDVAVSSVCGCGLIKWNENFGILIFSLFIKRHF